MSSQMRWTFRLLIAALVVTSALACVAVPAEAKSHSKYGVSLAVSPVSGASPVTGDPLSFSGKVTGKSTKRVVTVQYRYPGHSWHTMVKATISASGEWRTSVRVTTSGKRYYRVYKPTESSYHRSNYSKTVTVTIGQKLTSVVTPIAHGSTTVTDASMSACAGAAVRTPGVDGSSTKWYRDGKYWKTVVFNPVTEVRVVGSGACPQPAATSLNPSSGSFTGGETVSFFGTGLSGVTKVTFTPIVRSEWTISGNGSMPAVPALGVTLISDGRVDVVVPPGLGGPATVTLTSGANTTTATYTYTLTARSASPAETAFVAQVNEFRAEGYDCEYGIDNPVAGPLTWDGKLADYSNGHNADLLNRNDVYTGLNNPHLYPGLSFPTSMPNSGVYRQGQAGYTLGSVGEVIVQHFHESSVKNGAQPVTTQDGTDAAVAFMSSVGHCKILMMPRATHIGAGIDSQQFTDKTWGLFTTASVSG